MATRLCQTTCPVHGHWCDQKLPHDRHRSMEICQCIWDGDEVMYAIGGIEVEVRPWRRTEDVPLPEPITEGGEPT